MNVVKENGLGTNAGGSGFNACVSARSRHARFVSAQIGPTPDTVHEMLDGLARYEVVTVSNIVFKKTFFY